ncbi:hypothetical protein P154DRAFT_353817 [Amniculicola lignicola CBS 123094]|uniref:HECT-type E3 ubiquitin transferase n=1 Tax=Amniculicola lignicola CBS 123094 TaxID=1392246 RepID=A0A6A5WTL1_9PLEO|nr:hypothetical protein P154DRAFT_353817 [Amniculicola lignicola CBS 123094]
MPRIKKQATSRHEATLSPMIKEFVQATASIPLYQIPQHLASFPKLWPFPRGDTYHWIPVLNRFDRILELFTKEYGLVDGPQTQPFQRRLLLRGDAEDAQAAPQQATTDAVLDELHMSHDADRALIEQIVAFTRLLLENCGNRSLYSSSSHLDKLLNSTSSSLLQETLRLGLRLAQRYQAARNRLGPATLHPALLASHYNFNLDKLLKLTTPFSKAPASTAPVFATPAAKSKEKGPAEQRNSSDKIHPSDLVGLFVAPESTIKQEYGGVVVTFYEPSAAPNEHGNSPPHGPADAPATPTPIRRASSNRPAQTPGQPQSPSMSEPPTTPSTVRESEGSRASGPKTFELSPDTVSTTNIHELVKGGLAELPESAHYDFLHKLRTAQALGNGASGREDAVAVRLLAIANMGFVHGEKDFHTKIGQLDTDEPRRVQLAQQLSELVHPPGNGEMVVSRRVQTFALNALEALVKHKMKAPDVCAALAVNVNHGVLFYIVRKAVAELGVDDDYSVEEDEWREGLFSLLNTLPTSQPRTGEGMVSAGLLEILVEVLTLRTVKAERNYPKVLCFLDTFVYNLRDAFSALVQAKGLDIIAELTAHEVETSKKLAEEKKGIPAEYKTQLTDYQIPFYHQQTLRWLFKFTNHMMSHHAGGNFDRLLRNLIDCPPLLVGLKTVLSNAKVFGATVWSMAVNILTSFIHNEPTSYVVIAEAGLSEAFLETVSCQPLDSLSDPADVQPNASTRQSPLAQGILPVAEAISTLPAAFGAICLAEAGMKLFQSSPALSAFFEIFESPVHVKALDMDADMANMIGQSVDELVRHHPPLKSKVLKSLSEMIDRVERLCDDKAKDKGIGAKLWAEKEDGTIIVAGGREALLRPKDSVAVESVSGRIGDDIEMQDADEQPPSNGMPINNEITHGETVETEDSSDGPTTSQYISVLCRFLMGFFGNHTMCSAFVDANGVESILDLATLPCVSHKFNDGPSSPGEQFAQVVQVLIEQKPHIAIPAILKRTQRALDLLEPMLNYSGKGAFFAPFTSLPASDVRQSPELSSTWTHGTEYLKSLITVHTMCNALTLTFQGQLFSPRSTHNVATQVNLADMYARLVDSLGKLHQTCVWEEILLQKNMPTEWEKETRIKSSGFGMTEADDVLHLGHSAENSVVPDTGNGAPPSGSGTTAARRVSLTSQASACFKNTQVLRYLLSKIPTGITPFFQSLGKQLLFRRNPDSYQKQCAVIVADQLAQAAINQLQLPGPKASESPEDRYAYWIVILTSISQLMVETGPDRVTPQALTLILQSFKHLGGFAVLEEILNGFFESALSISKTQDDTQHGSQRLLNLSLGGLKIIMAFYSQIINGKTITEASQTNAMGSRADRDRPDPFIPAQFLVELRYAVIKPVRKIWNSELVDKATTSIVKTSINILKTVLDGEAEGGAYKTLEAVPERKKPVLKPWKPRNEESHMSRLKESGFDESLALEALYRCCDNFNTAREYCQNQTRDLHSSRNPLPNYEVEARTLANNSPHRAEVVVPESADNASVSTGDDTGDGEDSEAPDSQSVDMEDAEAPQEPEESASTTPVPGASSETPAESSWDDLAYLKRVRVGIVPGRVSLQELDIERVDLRKNLIERSLDILNSHDDVTFELGELISAAVSKAPEPAGMRQEIGETLVQSLISLSGDNIREQGKKIAASAHLLALVIQTQDFYESIVSELRDSLPMLLDFIKIPSDQPPEESTPWIGQVLLIVERLLAEDQLPPQIQWTPPSADNKQEDPPVDEVVEPVVTLDEKNQIFDAILDVLPRIGKDESLALSVMRVLVMLSRTRKIALRLSEKRNIQRLFMMVRQLAGITNEGLRSAFMIVLRHMVEDEDMIRQIMRSEIQNIFESRDRRNTDTTGYTRQMYYLALRAPEIFVEVTNEKLQLARFDPNQRPQHLLLKKDGLDSDVVGNSNPTDQTQTQTQTQTANEDTQPRESTEPKKGPLQRTKTSDLKTPIVRNPVGVVHYLVCELLAYKEVDDKTDSMKNTESSNAAAEGGQPVSEPTTAAASSISEPDRTEKPEKPEFKSDGHPIYIYRCFILKCLAELVQSYNCAKVEFLTFSRKADPHAATPSKPRSHVVQYLLNTLVPIGTLNHEGDLAFKKRIATSSCAIDLLVSLCTKTGETGPSRLAAAQTSPYDETDADLLWVRKYVLDHASRAFKEASASDEPLDMKYSRLMNIADIFSKMVSQRADGTSLNQSGDLTPALKQMAKLMYEKGLIPLLTTAIADVDLNFPNAKRAVKYILKPLRWLCAVAVDLSTHYDTSSALSGSTDEFEISSASDDDVIDMSREETPDLFRNSTLGMFEHHESESEPSDEEDDDEMYDEQFADDMDYDEEMDEGEVISDEDDEMGEIEGLSGDGHHMNIEVVIDDDGEEVLSQDDDEGSEDDDEEEDDEEDMVDETMEMLENMEDALEGRTGDDENGSLDEDDEDDGWVNDHHFDPAMMPDIPPGALGFVLDPPQIFDGHDQVHGAGAGGMEEYEDEHEDEDDDEEDDFDEEEMMYNPGIEDDGMPDWDFGDGIPAVRAVGGHRWNPWMFPTGPGDRILVPQTYRTHRPGAGGPRNPDDGLNPLLHRSGRAGPRAQGDGPWPSFRHEGASDWVHALEGRGARILSADSPVSFISHLLTAMSQGAAGPSIHQATNGALHLSFPHLPLGMPTPFDANFRREMQRARDSHMSRSAREDPQSAVSFVKAFTAQRWQEEARILYAQNAIEKSQRVINSILKLMVPPAIELAEKRRAELEAERQRKIKEEQERQEQKEREEREAKEKEERERQEREAAEAEARAAEESGQSQEATIALPEGQPMEGVEAGQPTEEASTSAEAGPSEAAPRVVTTIRGRDLDITGMGIDLEYLEALPEELREEVLMQQLAEQRSQATQAGEQPSDISQEFLNALPPEIREELLQQEAQDRRRREREEARRRSQANSGAAAQARAEEMDTASFLASLDPGLRQAVLMDQDEDVLRQLPPEISAEARAYGGDRRLNQFNEYLPTGYRRGNDRRANPDDPSQKRKARPCVQMLDKAGVATLLRLMFIPQQGSAKTSLSYILRYVCENRQNRAEVISMLLTILQDGSGDVSAVERSFAQLSLKAKQPREGSDKTPKATRKAGNLSISAEVSPLMVVQQCLHTLWQLTDKNPPVWSFFLTEQELSLKSRTHRKGKGKETKAMKYPINGLLSLLDRRVIIESSSIMEQLTMLLRVITVPLQALKKEKEKPTEEAKITEPAETNATNVNEAELTAPTEGPPQGEDTQMAGAPELTSPEITSPEGGQAPEAEATSSKPEDAKVEDDKKKHRTLSPPEVPETNLRLVAKILAARECNSKVFQETLSVISNLSPIPGAKEVFGNELLGIAQDLAQSTLNDLANLTGQVSKAESPTDVQGMALSKFSPPSSDQAKLLRALTALDYLFDPTRDSKDKPASNAEALDPAQKEDILITLYENPMFGQLWTKLSECLTVIRQRGNMLNIATILLPLIEALMVVCKNTTLKDAPLGKLVAKEFALSSPPPESMMENLFFTFTDDHRKILNDLVRQNPKLMSGTFSLLVKNSKVLEFDNKRNYFNRRLHSRTSERERQPHPPLQLAVRRDQVFLDSFKSLYFKTADEMKYGKLSIRFHGEEGVDAGGVTREWFQVIARQMFNPDYALFVPVASDRTTFHPNRLSAINPEHLMFFKFIGRIIGKALYEGRVLDCHFSRAVYKRILGRPVNLKDMETLDLEYYKSLQWMLENDITDIITEMFSVDVEAFGETQTVDLIENGHNIPVTEDNKHEYIRLVTEHRLTGAVHEQLENFLKGFHDIVPEELVSIFSEQELELLISGLPDINVDDWKNNTEYHNYTAASPQIQWFWRAMRSFDKEERAKLLQFVTGTSKVPLNGFRELEGMNGFSRFNIHRDYGSKDRLPSSHTCFNQLDLPEYETYEDLRKHLYTAMTAGGEYFGFA